MTTDKKTPTIVDKYIIPYYVRFTWGFGLLVVWISLLNFGMAIVTMVTVKGIFIPLWMIPAVGGLVVVVCTAVGYYFEKWDVMNLITSHANREANPEMKQISDDVKEIKKILKERGE